MPFGGQAMRDAARAHRRVRASPPEDPLPHSDAAAASSRPPSRPTPRGRQARICGGGQPSGRRPGCSVSVAMRKSLGGQQKAPGWSLSSPHLASVMSPPASRH